MIRGKFRIIAPAIRYDPDPGTIQESPGAIHTLVSDNPEGMKTFFLLNGAIEFFDENENLLDTLDVFWFIDHYVSYCREHGIPVNKTLWV